MGLLEQMFGTGGDDPRSQAMSLLAAGLGRGDIHGGLLAGNQVFAAAPAARAKREMEQMQLEANRMKLDAERKQMAFLENLPSPAMQSSISALGAGGGPTNANAARIQPVSPSMNLLYEGTRAGAVPLGDYLKSMQPKEAPINKLDVKDFTPASVAKFAQTQNYGDLVRMDKLHFADTGGAIKGLNPFTGESVGGVAKSGNPFENLVLGDGLGGFKPNAPLIAAKSAVAKAGASNTNISVNTEKSLLNEIAGGLGKTITEAKGGAQGALNTIATVNRLNDALDSGKVMAGPGTSFRQYGLQVGNMLGIGGKDAQEKMLNTRAAIQSLAQLELDGAQQMKGQGQITEAERSIIKRAASGDVDSMTTGELRVLSGVLDRSARTKIRSYNAQVTPLKSNPNASPIAPFLDVAEPPERTAPNVLRFDAQGNPIR